MAEPKDIDNTIKANEAYLRKLIDQKFRDTNKTFGQDKTAENNAALEAVKQSLKQASDDLAAKRLKDLENGAKDLVTKGKPFQPFKDLRKTQKEEYLETLQKSVDNELRDAQTRAAKKLALQTTKLEEDYLQLSALDRDKKDPGKEMKGLKTKAYDDNTDKYNGELDIERANEAYRNELQKKVEELRKKVKAAPEFPIEKADPGELLRPTPVPEGPPKGPSATVPAPRR